MASEMVEGDSGLDPPDTKYEEPPTNDNVVDIAAHRQREAEKFVRRCLRIFGQEESDATIVAVAEKVVKALPKVRPRKEPA